jgi:NAD(P)H-nitrite reductase large subunit
LGTEVGKAMYDLNTQNGITLEMEQFVEKYVPSDADKSKVGFVVLKSGKKIAADFVILGAGVVPKTDYLKTSGIPLDKDGGITVNGSMQVSGVQDVFAIGII